jgi:hypothetical protein
MDRLGHSTTVAAVRYQHVMADRDAAIARELNRLIEGRVSAAMAWRWHAGPRAYPCQCDRPGVTLGLGLLVWCGAPRRNRTGDPILTIDARRVRNALRGLTCPHDRAGERRCRRLGRGAARGCV